MMRHGTPAWWLAGILLSLVAPRALAGQGEAGLPLGTRAPSVVVKDLDGNPVDLGSWIGKKPLLLEFWAVWCENCEALLPRMKQARQWVGDRVEFLGVAVAVSQSRDRVRRYAEQHGMPFRILYDDDGTAVRAYQAPVTSYVVIVDRGGKVAYTGVGADQAFEPVLREVSGLTN
jgi:peroxiredoxin